MFRLKSIQLTDQSPENGHNTSGRLDGTLKKQKQRKLASRLKELKDLLRETNGNRVVLLQWHATRNALLLAFNSGLICWVFLDLQTWHIQAVSFDKSLVGKLVTDHVVDFAWKENEGIFVSYTEPRITGVFMTSRPSQSSPSSPQTKGFKLKHDPALRLVEADLDIKSTTRRVPRHLVVNSDPDSLPLLLVWWQLGPNSVSPWSAPIRSERDLANLLLYNYAEAKFDFISYGSITSEIVKVAFSRLHNNQIIVVSAGDTRTSLKFTILEISASADESLITVFSLNIALITPCIEVNFTSSQEKLMILCEDRTVMMFSINENAVYSLRVSIDCINIMCNTLDAFFLVSDKFGQLLMYDYALGVIPANYDDLGYNAHLDQVAAVKQMKFLNDNVVCLRYAAEEKDDANLTLVILPQSIDVISLISEYLNHDYLSEAIANLLTLDWNFDAFMAYRSLNLIFNFLLKQPLNQMRETQIIETLGAFFRPVYPIEESVHKEYELGMHFLAKRFVYHLLRFNSMETAYQLALDLDNRHLFLLLYKFAQEKGDLKLSEVCLAKASACKTRSKHRHHHHRNHSEVEASSSLGDHSSPRNPSQPVESPLTTSLPYPPVLTSPELPARRSNFDASLESSYSPPRPPVPAPRKLSTPVASSNSPALGGGAPSAADREVAAAAGGIPASKPPPVERASKPWQAKRLSASGNGLQVRNGNADRTTPSLGSNGIANEFGIPNHFANPALHRKKMPMQPPLFQTPLLEGSSPGRAESLPTPPALPPRRTSNGGANGASIPAIDTAETPPPIPPKTFLQNNNLPQAKPPTRPYSNSRPMTIYDPQPPSTILVREPMSRPAPERVSLNSSISSSSSTSSEVDSSLESPSSSSFSSSHSDKDVSEKILVEKGEKPKIECISFGIV